MNARRTNRSARWLLTTGLFLTLAWPASVARAANYVVSLNEASLRQAILAANAAAGEDTITFNTSGTILLTQTLPAITDPAGLTIDGAGQSITISGNNAVRVMEVNSGAALTVRNLTVAGGYKDAGGGGIYNNGTLTVNNCTFSGNHVGTAVIGANGGGIENWGGTLVVTDSTFSGNSATILGGGIFSQGIATVTHSTFSGNYNPGAQVGAGIGNAGGTMTVTDSTFSVNKGGGIYNSATLSVTHSTFSGNYSADGAGGILGYGTLTVANSTFLGNKGGGISYSGTLIVTHSTFSGNTPSGTHSDNGGSGISISGMATVADSTFSANTAPDGGGIHNDSGTLTVTGSTFAGNTGFSTGGGIYNRNIATLIVTNSTFSGNSAPSGGGIFNDDGGIYGYWGSVTVTNTTFSGNAGGGAGIFNGGRLTLQNTIVANSNAMNCINTGSLIDSGGNLSWPDASCPGLNADPLLGPLQDNGGPTQTHALLAGSPALDAALLANCPPADQRGVSRPQGPGCDSGAYELGVESIPPTITLTTPADGEVYTLGQAVPAEYACQDEAGGSGIAACVGTVPNGSPIDTSSVGVKTFTVNAADNAGNFASLTHSYSVVYAFSGFFQPVDNLPTLNVVKAGLGVPVRFSLSGDQGLAIFAAGYPATPKIPCTGGTPEDAIEETVTAGSSSLSYDAASDTYTYVWKTNSAWIGTCRQLIIRLKDGTEHMANFRFLR